MHILVPINFDEPSLKGINYALSIADPEKDKITTIQVLPPKKAQTAKLAHRMQELKWEEDEAHHQAQLKEFIAKTSKPNYHYQDHLLRRGDLSKRVLVETLDNDYDLIIMGTKGGSKLKATLFSSKTFNLLKMATIPTIAVPETWVDTSEHNACVALRFDNVITPICERLLSVSKALSYSTQVMTVVNKIESTIGINIQHEGESLPLYISADKQPTKAISKFIADNNISLLCLHFNIYSSLGSLANTSAAEEFSFRSPIPILFTK